MLDTTPSRKAWHAVIRRDPCSYCGINGPKAREVDHIVAKPFENEATNWTAACRHCNSSKGCRTLLFALSGLDVGYRHQSTRLSIRRYGDK